MRGVLAELPEISNRSNKPPVWVSAQTALVSPKKWAVCPESSFLSSTDRRRSLHSSNEHDIEPTFRQVFRLIRNNDAV
jgi:hypothetical protein